MPKPKIRLAGFVSTDAYLTVHFTIAWSTTTRYLEIKVPMAALAKDVQFGTAYERAMASLLKSFWELDNTLPGLDGVAEQELIPWDRCSDDCTGCDHVEKHQ